MPQANSSPFPSRSDGAATGAQWKQLYASALLETDPQRAPAAITVARRAMLERAFEIITKPVSEEHVRMNSALRMLRILEEVAGHEAAGYHAA
jgi:hypothetical protein